MTLAELWLPILLSAVFVFVVSSVIHMVIPIHKNDYKELANEADVLAGMRAQGVQPGQYRFPYCSSMQETGTAEYMAKLNEGPVGFMSIMPNGPFAMGKGLIQWFVFSLVVGVAVAYVAGLTLGVGAGPETSSPDAMLVFRATGTMAFIAYGLGPVPDSIWKGVSWGVTAKFVFDGLLYGLATGAAFAWFWPPAA